MRRRARPVKEVAFIVTLSRITAVLFPPAMSFLLEGPHFDSSEGLPNIYG